MKKEKTDEIGLRRKLFRLFDKGTKVKQILQRLPRSRAWVYKWKARYECAGRAAASGQPTIPKHAPHAYAQKVVRLVLRVRQRLQRSAVGLSGAKAIQRELKHGRLLRHIPSRATINRMLRRGGALTVGTAPPSERGGGNRNSERTLESRAQVGGALCAGHAFHRTQPLANLCARPRQSGMAIAPRVWL